LEHAIEVESVFFVPLSYLHATRGNQIGQYAGTRRPIEYEVQHDVITVLPRSPNLPHQRQPFLVKDVDSIDPWIEPNYLLVQRTGKHSHAKMRVALLDEPKDRGRDDHITQAIVSQDHYGADSGWRQRKIGLRIA
jgi:hypothetical protein